MEPLFVLLAFAVSLGVAYVVERLCRRRMATWAVENGYELVSAKRSWLSFRFLRRSGEQRVYEIVLRDAEGREQVAWARVGGYFLGELSNEIDVRWD
jgi:hypothetical protein